MAPPAGIRTEVFSVDLAQEAPGRLRQGGYGGGPHWFRNISHSLSEHHYYSFKKSAFPDIFFENL